MFFQRRVPFFHTCNKDVCTDRFSNYHTNCFEFGLTLVDFFLLLLKIDFRCLNRLN